MLYINLLQVAMQETVDVISIFASYFSAYHIVNLNKQTRNKENDTTLISWFHWHRKNRREDRKLLNQLHNWYLFSYLVSI